MNRYIRIERINGCECAREALPVDCFLDEDEGNPYFTYDYYCDRGKIKVYIEKSEFEDIWKKLMSLDYSKILEENCGMYGYDGWDQVLYAG